jgi:hypothetical protein
MEIDEGPVTGRGSQHPVEIEFRWRQKIVSDVVG